MLINIVFNIGLTISRAYLFILGIGLLITGDPVTGIGHILIAGIMGLLAMPWPDFPDPDELEQRANDKQ